MIPRSAHNISKANIAPNALTVLNRLEKAGFQAYLVGGSVRDLLLHKVPKDFDIATNATPNEVRRLFRNAWIIGRRFKLVHVTFHKEIIEVATFRAHAPNDPLIKTSEHGMIMRDNLYGTIHEDAWRRDFTINSLYYAVSDGAIIDLTGGFKDIREKKLRIIGEPATRYQEDPVRMLRAIRFAAKLDFSIDDSSSAQIQTLGPLLQHVSSARLFEEITKLYQGGSAAAAHKLLMHYNLLPFIFPA
ncbi:MAG: polynucleotide adenylyltransferase PcnB, partial [Legionellaceae bacterium]|nr:polynucleotide adenylyltransferase PcnB [Legionellaceae bacterium]